MSNATTRSATRMVLRAAMALFVAGMISACPSTGPDDSRDAEVIVPCAEADESDSNLGVLVQVQQVSSSSPEYFTAIWREDQAIRYTGHAGSLGCTANCRIDIQRGPPDGGAGTGDGGGPVYPLLAMTGTVTIEGVGTTAIVFTLGATYFQRQNARGIEGGERVVARASGMPGGLRAFEAEWSAPAQATINEPALAVGEFVPVDPDSDLNLAWTPSPQGEGTLILEILGSGNRNRGGQTERGVPTIATCSFPARGGQGSIPAAVLRAFADHTRDQLLMVSAHAITSTMLAVDGHEMLFVTDIDIARSGLDIREPDAGTSDTRDAGPIDSALGADS